MSDELKPCPCCSGEAELMDYGVTEKLKFEFTGLVLAIQCQDCYLKVSGYDRELEDNSYEAMLKRALKKWNTRPTTKEQKDITMSFNELKAGVLKFKAKSEYQQAAIVILRELFKENNYKIIKE